MAHQYLATNATPKPGVLDALADGISHVLAKPALIAIPLLLDALLIFAPRVSGASLGQDLAARFAARDLLAFQQFGGWLARQGDWAIERGLAFLLPSVVDGIGAGDRYAPYTPDVLRPGGALGGILLLVSVLIGAMLFMGFETWIARSTGIAEDSDRSLMAHIGRSWLAYLGVIALVLIFAAVVIGGMLAPAWIANQPGPDGDTLIAVTSLVGLVVLIATMFVPEAIVLDAAGPLSAIRKSVTVVATNFWQSMAFFLVTFLITPGLLAIWETIAFDPLGLAIAIVLNAGMVTSLAIASLAFYRARSESVPTA